MDGRGVNGVPARGLAEAAGGVEHLEGGDDGVGRMVAGAEVGRVVVGVHEVLRDLRRPLRAGRCARRCERRGGGQAGSAGSRLVRRYLRGVFRADLWPVLQEVFIFSSFSLRYACVDLGDLAAKVRVTCGRLEMARRATDFWVSVLKSSSMSASSSSNCFLISSVSFHALQQNNNQCISMNRIVGTRKPLQLPSKYHHAIATWCPIGAAGDSNDK